MKFKKFKLPKWRKKTKHECVEAEENKDLEEDCYFDYFRCHLSELDLPKDDLFEPLPPGFVIRVVYSYKSDVTHKEYIIQKDNELNGDGEIVSFLSIKEQFDLTYEEKNEVFHSEDKWQVLEIVKVDE